MLHGEGNFQILAKVYSSPAKRTPRVRQRTQNDGLLRKTPFASSRLLVCWLAAHVMCVASCLSAQVVTAHRGHSGPRQ